MKKNINQKLEPFIATLFLMLTLGVFGQQTKPMTLKECVDYATNNLSTVKNAGLDEKIAQQKVRELTGIGLPNASADVSFNDYLKIPTSLIPNFFGGKPNEYIPIQFGVQYNASAGATVSQLIFDGSYIVGLQAAKGYVALSRKNTQRTKVDAAEQVTKAYYMNIINKERLKIFDLNIERLEKAFKDTKGYQEQGFVEAIDVARLEVSLNNLKTEKEKTSKMLETGLLLLKFQMGMPITEMIEPSDSIASLEIKQIETGEADPSKRIEYQLYQSQIELNKLDIKRHKFSYLPSLSGFFTWSTQAQRQKLNFADNKGLWFQTGILGFKLSVPIFDGFQKDARIQQAKIALEKTNNDLNNFSNYVSFQVKSAFISYENSFRTLEIQKRNMDLAKEVVRVSQIKFKEGVGGNLEITTAEAALKEAQINYYDALYSAVVAKIDLQKSKGTLY